MAHGKITVTPKFSKKYWAVQKRIQRIPKEANGLMKAKTKRDALDLIRFFQDGIRKNAFGLKALNPVTIERKQALGQPFPDIPLMGEGLNEADSYINMLKVYELKNGYQVKPRPTKHHSGKITLKHLFMIHEYGCIIKVTEKMRAYLHVIGIHFKANKTFVRIPPRPAFKKAYDKLVRGKARKENVARVRKALRQFIRDGDKQHLIKEEKAMLRGYEKENARSR